MRFASAKDRKQYFAIQAERKKKAEEAKKKQEEKQAAEIAAFNAQVEEMREKRKVSLLDRENIDHDRFGEFDDPTRIYREKSDKKPVEGSFATNKAKRLSRKFVELVGKQVSTLHGNGIYAFCALVCHAHTYDFYGKGYAWVSGTKKEIMKMIGARTEKEMNTLLGKLESGQALHVCHAKTTDKIVVQLLDYLSVENMPRKAIQAEYAAINTHSGYVYVNPDIMTYARVTDNTYSEADALLDMWFSVVYRDIHIPFSKSPVVNLHDDGRFAVSNCKDTIIYGYRDYAKRWKCSLGRVGKIMSKFQDLGFVNPQYVPNHGTVIFMPIYVQLLFEKKAKKINKRKICDYFIPNNYVKKIVSFIKEMAKKRKVKRYELVQFLEKMKKYAKSCIFKNEKERVFYFFTLTFWRSLFEHPEFDDETLARQAGEPFAGSYRIARMLFI